MPILIGVDEAGYGPNLGPLVVMATVWRVPHGVGHGNLYSVTRSLFTADPPTSGDERLWLADSKRVFRTASGLAQLERTVVPLLPDTLPSWPCSFPALWYALDSRYAKDGQRVPWFAPAGPSARVPTAAERVRDIRPRVLRVLAQEGIALIGIQGSVIVARRFNSMLRREGNKSRVLTKVTLQLVRQLIEHYRPEPMDIVCDRHGGRHYYAAALQACLGREPVLARGEDRECSRYQIGVQEQGPQVRFLVRSESLMATALASMTAKYVRELAMDQFNAFWSAQVPGLRRTAGYPQDARRFRQEIADRQRALGISDTMLWRRR